MSLAEDKYSSFSWQKTKQNFHVYDATTADCTYGTLRYIKNAQGYNKSRNNDFPWEEHKSPFLYTAAGKTYVRFGVALYVQHV